MTVLCMVTLLFVSSMLMNVTYEVMTGIGTIDRLKNKATQTSFESEEEPMPLKDIFGIQGTGHGPCPLILFLRITTEFWDILYRNACYENRNETGIMGLAIVQYEQKGRLTQMCKLLFR